MLTLFSLAVAGAKTLCTLSVPSSAARRARLQAAAVALFALSTLGLAGGGPAQAAPATVVDAVGRSVTFEAPAPRIVLMFNYEEATAVAGPAGWDRIVGISKGVWAGWRPAIWQRYVAVACRD
jgi:ABC-type Fe3+-hydroxamate transport system substrate-binding protein